MRSEIMKIAPPRGGTLPDYFIGRPGDACRGDAIKWDGESKITHGTFRESAHAPAELPQAHDRPQVLAV